MKKTLSQLIDDICGSNTGIDLAGFEEYEVRIAIDDNDVYGKPAEVLDIDQGSKTIWLGV